jgi:hypothetical protein
MGEVFRARHEAPRRPQPPEEGGSAAGRVVSNYRLTADFLGVDEELVR